jgi:hypothetical protein
MLTEDCEIALATAEDIAGILDLQERNQPERGGTLSARLPRAWLEAAVGNMPVFLARREGRVVGCRGGALADSSPVLQVDDRPDGRRVPRLLLRVAAAVFRPLSGHALPVPYSAGVQRGARRR